MTYLDQIEKYLKGELSREESERFEERMKLNPRLAEDTLLYKELTGFLSENIESVDKMITTVDDLNKTVLQDEWNRAENARLVDKISKIMVYLGDNIHADIYKWLRNEAVLYPELVDTVLNGIDEELFNKGYLEGDDCLKLYDNLVGAYESFSSIDSLVDDFLLNKPLPGKNNLKSDEKKPVKNTRIYQLPVVEAKSEVTRKKSVRYIFSIAASLAILIAAGSIMWLIPSRHASGDQLYADFYNGYTVSTVQRSATPVISGDFYKGMENFSGKAYKAAIISFSKVSEGDINYVPACFFTGISKMEMNQFMPAADMFNKVLKAGSSNLAADAQWHMALCYLKIGKIAQTRRMLNDVVSNNPFYKEKALELLNKLPE